MPIRPDRLLADMRALAAIGQHMTGVNRPAFSDADIAAREWLRNKMMNAGLAAEIDCYGNVYGRAINADRTVVIGSHSDTVPFGGWLDGAMGVIYGLEIARCITESGSQSCGIDVISFQDEEGTYLPFLGSRAFCGDNLTAEIETAKSKDGQTLKDAMSKAALPGNAAVRLDPRRHAAYFEAHIEQGPRLESSGRKIGVVTAIVGIKSFRLLFRGQANHAGTTPMDMRHDAGGAAMCLGNLLNQRMPAIGGPQTVWNVGNMRFEPGAINVVPVLAEVFLQVRDISPAVLAEAEHLVRALAAICAESFKVDVEVECLHDTEPAAMTPALAKLIEKAAAELGAPSASMPSGAGHDAMIVVRHIPSAMLFVPSIGGRSHHVSEDTSDVDIVLGAQVLLRAIELFMANGAR
jgi:N-carbamoyl-L-amino-acid hydrolase